MLRGRPENPPPAAGDAAGRILTAVTSTGFPGIEEAYATGERPVGVLFYQGRAGFFLPYHLLQSMRFEAERVTLLFAADEIILTGRGLHELYMRLAAQQVSRIVEQGARHAAVSEAPVLIIKIERIPRSRDPA